MRTRDILAQQLSCHCSPLLPAFFDRIPVSSDRHVDDLTRNDFKISDSSMPNEGIVDRYLDVEVGYGSRVIGRICDVDQRSQGEGVRAGSRDL